MLQEHNFMEIEIKYGILQVSKMHEICCMFPLFYIY